MKRIILILLIVLTGAALAQLARTPAPDDVYLYIVTPRDGATVRNPVVIVFGLRGMGVAPAGVKREKTGHHHLLIDTDPPPLDRPIPADENHRHFGGGQTETMIELEPGQHKLQLLLADYLHVPHEPAIVSEPIEILVVDDDD